MLKRRATPARRGWHFSTTPRVSGAMRLPWRSATSQPSRGCKLGFARPSAERGQEGAPEHEKGSVTSTSSTQPRTPASITAVVFGCVAIGALLSNRFLNVTPQGLQGAISGLGTLGPIIFVATYIAATVVLFPASVLTLGAGYLYGPLYGTLLVSVSSTSGAAAAFLLARYLLRPVVTEKLEAYPRFKAVDAKIAVDGAKVVFLLRLSPLFPFNLLNYGLGVTRVNFPEYVLASWVGMLPGTFLYVYLGSVAKEAIDLGATQGQQGPEAWGKLALYGLGAVATLLVVRLVAQVAGSAFDEDEQMPSGPDRHPKE